MFLDFVEFIDNGGRSTVNPQVSPLGACLFLHLCTGAGSWSHSSKMFLVVGHIPAKCSW